MRNYPAFMASLHISSVVRPLRQETVDRARPLVWTLFLAVGAVLLIACANLGGLLLVRATVNRHDLAVRLALGARSMALLRQTMLESLILSVCGGFLGVWIAAAAVRVGKNFLPESLPRISEIGLNWTVTAFALFLAIVTGLLCGLAPGLAALRTNLTDTLKEAGRSGFASGGGHARLRSTLVIAEIAVAMILLTASGLLLRSFEKMSSVDLGFHPEMVTAATYSLPQKQYPTQSTVHTFNKEVLLRLRRLPGVEFVGITNDLPASGNIGALGFIPDGYIPVCAM
jgi:FtsX-like permease family